MPLKLRHKAVKASKKKLNKITTRNCKKIKSILFKKQEPQKFLQKNAAAVCLLTGRASRSNILGANRHAFKKLAATGAIAGIRKSSR
jgi:ribosomal protein S14